MTPIQFPRTLRSFFVPLALALSFASLAACAGGEPTAETEPAPAEATPEPEARTYTVRGRLVELPNPDDPTTGLYIHHEPIDDYVDMDGELTGMDSMTMPFATADDLDLGGLSTEDKVEFELAVDWAADPMIQVTRIEPIDPGTQLEFRKARPPER